MENFNGLQEQVDTGLQKAGDIINMLKKVDISKIREGLNSQDFTSKIHGIIGTDGKNFLNKIISKGASFISSLADGNSKFGQMLKGWGIGANNDIQRGTEKPSEIKPKTEAIPESEIFRAGLDISKSCQQIVSGNNEQIKTVISIIDRLETQGVNIKDTCMIMPNNPSFIMKLGINPKEAEKFQKTNDGSVLIPYSSLREGLKNNIQSEKSSNEKKEAGNNVNEVGNQVLSSAKELERRIRGLDPLSGGINGNIEKGIKMGKTWISENRQNFDTISQNKSNLNPETHRELLVFLNKAQGTINSGTSSFLVSGENKRSLGILAKDVDDIKSRLV